MKKIIIIGSGTSGLMTASIFKRFYAGRVKVEVYYDSKRKTIGVGESTTQAFVDFIRRYLHIHPADFINENLRIQNNIIHNSYEAGVKKLIFLGSSCIYPKFPKIPITEDQLMTSPLEESNSAYAIAKIAGMRMCQAYKEQYGLNAISLMPTNLYGINDNFDLENSHVLPAMIRKFHEAEDKVTLWGDGSAMREFLHVDDLAEACYVCMQKYEDDEHINVGTGEDVTIKELAETVAKVVGNKSIEWDTSKPNGTPRKVLNVDKIKSLGWEPKISLEEGIKSTYEWYCSQL